MQDFAKNIENINNIYQENLNKLDAFLLNSNLDTKTKDKIIEAREGFKSIPITQDANKVFEIINNFNK